MIENEKFRVIGLMSGTSLDGLDMVDVTIHQKRDGKWQFNLNNSQLVSYDSEWMRRLKNATELPATELARLSTELGVYYSQKVNQFIENNSIPKEEVSLIASHGQTIFHQPKKGYTLQIGNGPELAINTGLLTVTDFRTKDVALGGNGAPLIHVADFLLFDAYADSFLNLGGFSNYSYKMEGSVRSFDICPVNIVVNHLALQQGLTYDKNGGIGAKGEVDSKLLSQLNSIEYYQKSPPKSLGWEWVAENILPLFENENLRVEDAIRTYYEHIAIQIGRIIDTTNSSSVLVTGGGAKNKFLIRRMQEYVAAKIVIPSEIIIDFKEALGFAFLGLLRWQNKVNVWASVTGAKQDSSSGVITLP